MIDILPQDKLEKELEEMLELENLNFELLAKTDRCSKKKTHPPPSLSSLDISNQGSSH